MLRDSYKEIRRLAVIKINFLRRKLVDYHVPNEEFVGDYLFQDAGKDDHMSAAWPSKAACGFQNRRREFKYGCRPTVYDAYYNSCLGWLMAGGDSKSACSFPSHLHLYLGFKLVVAFQKNLVAETYDTLVKLKWTRPNTTASC